MSLDLADPPNAVPVRATTRILTPAPTASFGVVSDMDDTVLQSEVTSFLRAARMVLLENALTRLPFPGVAAFYRALERGATGAEANPIFYVSSSPWNLYNVIDGFLEAQRIPTGPLLLRDWDLGRLSERHARHKGTVIREIFDTYPRAAVSARRRQRAGGSGDLRRSGARATRRVKAVYIRNVTPNPERLSRIQTFGARSQEAGSTLVLADDTLAVARHAAMHGWISADALGEIGGEKRDDEGETGVKADTPGVETKRSPTVVVDPDISSRRRHVTHAVVLLLVAMLQSPAPSAERQSARSLASTPSADSSVRTPAAGSATRTGILDAVRAKLGVRSRFKVTHIRATDRWAFVRCVEVVADGADLQETDLDVAALVERQAAGGVGRWKVVESWALSTDQEQPYAAFARRVRERARSRSDCPRHSFRNAF